MNIKEVKNVLPVLIKHKIVPILWGTQGIGKTAVVKQIAKSMGYDSVVHLLLASQEVGDLVGVLLEQPDGTAKHARPNWFPKEGKHLIFLDEINRAHPDVLQAMFTFILEGKIHQHVLPEGCAIVAAANYANNNRFNVTDTSDQAFMSRFCHIDFKPTTEEFTTFVEDKGGDMIANFIRDYPQMLNPNMKDSFDFKMITPDNRTWADFILPLETESSIDGERHEVYSGLIGSVAATSFLTFKSENKNRITGKSILNNYESVRDSVIKMSTNLDTRFDLINSAFDEIIILTEKETFSDLQLSNLKKFLLDVPLEFVLKASNTIQDLQWKQKNSIINDPEFVASITNKALLEKQNKKPKKTKKKV